LVTNYNADIPYLQKVQSDHFDEWQVTLVKQLNPYKKGSKHRQQTSVTIGSNKYSGMKLLEHQLHPHTQNMSLEATYGSRLQSIECVFSPSKFKVSPGMYHLHLITEFEISYCRIYGLVS
jgi:hypothetical protein